MLYIIHRAIKHLLDVLKPHSIENGGPLKVEHVSFVKGRGNLMITYTPEGLTGASGEEMVPCMENVAYY